MASEMHKLIVRNMPKDELIEAITERLDLPDIVKMFRYHEDFAPREYLTVDELQKYLRCGRSYALEVAKYGLDTGEYHVNKTGRKYIVDRLSYERYVQRKLGKSLKEVL